jgi:hypothetical protein
VEEPRARRDSSMIPADRAKDINMASIGDVFKPGQTVEVSGIYTVTHDVNHRDVHEVTCVRGKTFPPCNHCGHRKSKSKTVRSVAGCDLAQAKHRKRRLK